MINPADAVGLTEEQARRYREIDAEIAQAQAAVDVWHRLLDRRRLDRKLGLHPITEFRLGEKVAPSTKAAPREPFYVHSENEAAALLTHCIGYLSDAEGEKFAFDRGYGGRDKMAEWIIHEIKVGGAIAYIRRRSPYIFGIPIVVA